MAPLGKRRGWLDVDFTEQSANPWKHGTDVGEKLVQGFRATMGGSRLLHGIPKGKIGAEIGEKATEENRAMREPAQ